MKNSERESHRDDANKQRERTTLPEEEAERDGGNDEEDKEYQEQDKVRIWKHLPKLRNTI